MEMRNLSVNVDSDLLEQADLLFDAMGMDTETAVKIFLKRAVNEWRLPFDLTAAQPKIPTTVTVPIQPDLGKTEHARSGKITSQMRERIWEVFKLEYPKEASNFRQAANVISEETGMNSSSALIYLYILNYLVNGKQNKRTMKIDDLRYYIDRIKAELPDKAYRASIRSLKLSIPYWMEKLAQSTADNASKLVEELESEDQKEASGTRGNSKYEKKDPANPIGRVFCLNA